MTGNFWIGFEKAAKEEKKKDPLSAKSVGLLTGGAVTGGLAVREARHNILRDIKEEARVPRSKNIREFVKKLLPGDIIFSRVALKDHPNIMKIIPAKWIETVQLLHGSKFNHSMLHTGGGHIIESPGPDKSVKSTTIAKEKKLTEFKAYRNTKFTKEEIADGLEFARKAKGTPYKSSPKLVEYFGEKVLGVGRSSATAAKNIGPEGNIVCTSLITGAFPKRFKKEYMGFNEIRDTPGMKLVARFGREKPTVLREKIILRGLSPTLHNLKWGVGAGLGAAALYKGVEAIREKNNK